MRAYTTTLKPTRWRHYLRTPYRSFSSTNPSQAPHVTVIRPVKGLEPHLYECLAATFRQDYPADRLTIYFCVDSRGDPAYPTLEKLVADFPHADARIYIEEEDPLLQSGSSYPLGPNPKIRNMSRAYREAKGDIVWIIDCNVWVGKGVCGRMVDKLCGFGSGEKYKFVHHLPIAVDVDAEGGLRQERQALLESSHNGDGDILIGDETGRKESTPSFLFRTRGGRLEELFLSSSHAKMYTAINTVLVAPCVVGKSNMFRRSHLDYLTTPSPTDPHPRNPGIDYFSDNICEDHLIGDLLWKKPIREEKEYGERWGKHALVFGDLAVQPVANMSVKAYIARRVRWLRVRKFTVLAATLVEPGTESFLCSLYGAFGVTTSVAHLLQRNGSSMCQHLSTWTAFFVLWLLSLAFWAFTDWTLYRKLHSGATVEVDKQTPFFARPLPRGTARRPFLHWFAAWLGREALALPIWIWAVWGGITVVWRDQKFKVGWDMKVREIGPAPGSGRFRTVSMDGSYDGMVPLMSRSSAGSSSSSQGRSITREERNKVRRD